MNYNMASHIYNVKQAAKILGLSTNTTYKYLNEGRIRAARGHVRGTFIITHKALETFLGTKLPDDPLKELDPNGTIPGLTDTTEAIIEVTPPSLSTKVTRALIIFALILLIIEVVAISNPSPLSFFNRLFLIFIFCLLAYQYGGFAKK